MSEFSKKSALVSRGFIGIKHDADRLAYDEWEARGVVVCGLGRVGGQWAGSSVTPSPPPPLPCLSLSEACVSVSPRHVTSLRTPPPER